MIRLRDLTQEDKEYFKMCSELREMRANWLNLLEVILEDSSVEEILNFALRLAEIPAYTKKQESARDFIRTGSNLKREFIPDGFGGGGSRWVEHKEEPVPLLELPQGLIKKGSKSWKITI
jgi:hypothetical protein